MDKSFCPKNSTVNYPKSTSTRNFKTIKVELAIQSASKVNFVYSTNN